MDSICDLTTRINAFRDARDWKQFHNPKDMAVSISIESAELLEQFQWKNAEECEAHLQENREGQQRRGQSGGGEELPTVHARSVPLRAGRGND